MIKHLEKLSLLVVEDNDQVRTLITSILRCIGVGDILKARDGEEAIEILKTFPLDHRTMTGCGIDLILCDWFMSPVDGISLLRWVRQHPESPNPFLPFVMISAIADANKIQRARDLGANGFLAKPFSIESVTGHLQTLLSCESTFIQTPSFFGPDRRKRYSDFYDGERRSQSNTEKTKRYKLLSVLPKKYHKGVPLSPDKFPIVDRQVLKEVKRELAKQTHVFLETIARYIASLESDCKACVNMEEKRRVPFFARMNSIAHELRGLGGIFEYPLIAIIAQSLYDLTSIHDYSEDCVQLINEHVHAFKAVIRLKIKGMGGEIGRELIDILDQANDKFVHRHDNKFLYK